MGRATPFLPEGSRLFTHGGRPPGSRIPDCYPGSTQEASREEKATDRSPRRANLSGVRSPLGSRDLCSRLQPATWTWGEGREVTRVVSPSHLFWGDLCPSPVRQGQEGQLEAAGGITGHR